MAMKQRTSGVRNNLSANWATTAVKLSNKAIHILPFLKCVFSKAFIAF